MRIACTGTDIRCTRRDILTTGMVGLTAEFHFNTEWDGISGKTAVFRSGDVSKEVLILSSGVVTVPWEVFHTAGEKLLVGVYGTDGEGNTWPAPTPYCDAGEVRKGTESAETGEAPTPSVVDQIMAAAAEAESVAQSVRDDADSGVFDGEDGEDGADGATFTPSVSENGVISWTNDKGLPNPTARNITGPEGKKGDTGETGPKGNDGAAGPNLVNGNTATLFNGVLRGNGSNVAVQPVDDTPTDDSGNLVTSGGVALAIATATAAIKAASDLTNYYTKSQTYTQAEVNALVSAIPKFAIEVVQTLPAEDISDTTVYLVPSGTAEPQNLYDEYIHTAGGWEKLGTQTVDLTGYATEAWVTTQLGSYLKTTDIAAWAKAATKPTYTKSEVGLGNVDNTSDAAKKTAFTGEISASSDGFVKGKDITSKLNDYLPKSGGTMTGNINMGQGRITSGYEPTIWSYDANVLVNRQYVDTKLAGKVSTADYAPVAKTAGMTQAVGKDGSGQLWTSPELPTVSAADNGKVLTVVSGAWAAAALPVYDGGVTYEP